MSSATFDIIWDLINKEKHPTLTGRELGRLYILRNFGELYKGMPMTKGIGYENPDFPVRPEENWNIITQDGELDLAKAEREQHSEERMIYANIRYFGQFVKRKRPEAKYQLAAALYRAERLKGALRLALIATDSSILKKPFPPENKFFSAFATKIKLLQHAETYKGADPENAIWQARSATSDILDIAKNISFYNFAIQEARNFYDIPEIENFLVNIRELKEIIAEYSKLRAEYSKLTKGDKLAAIVIKEGFKPINLNKAVLSEKDKNNFIANIHNLSQYFFLSSDMYF